MPPETDGKAIGPFPALPAARRHADTRSTCPDPTPNNLAPLGIEPGAELTVTIRGEAKRARVVPHPFVRDGRSRIDPYLSQEHP